MSQLTRQLATYVAESSLPSLDGHDGGLGADDVKVESDLETVADTVVDVDLPLLGRDTAGLGVENGVDTARKVHLAGGSGVAGNTDDGALGAVLGDEAGRDTRGREDDDGTGVLLNRGGDGRESEGLRGLGRAGSELAELVEETVIRDSRLGEVGGLSHHLDGLNGVLALGSLTGKHDTVSTVKDSVGDVRDLGTSGTGVDLTSVITIMFNSRSWTRASE